MEYTNIKKQLKLFLSYFYKRRYEYTTLTDEEYYKRFGIEKNENGEFTVIEENKERLKFAYEKAWENRNYEIDKFWTRAAYFWGFIVLIFGGYLTAITSDKIKGVVAEYLDLYLLSLGFLFSLAWFLVIRGSKCWQENWENHIDWLENFISGPIYKTVFYRQNRFYSVSKLNEVMSVVVIIVWLTLLSQTYYSRYDLGFNNINFVPMITLVITGLFTCIMLFGYCLTDIYHKRNKGFIDRWE